MCFTGKNQLDRLLRVGEKANQPLRIKQEKIGTFISRKAPRKSKSQSIFVEDVIRNRWISAFRSELTGIPFTQSVNQCLTLRGPHPPDLFVGEEANVIFDSAISAPTLFAASCCPKRVGLNGIPGRYMNAIGD